MGPILLPSTPGVKSGRTRMLDWGGPLTPSLGGAVQTLMRLGTRHAVEYDFPPMRSEPTGRIWAAQLRLAKLYGALFPFYQDGLRNFAIGAPVVAGSGQSGSSLVLRGFDPRGGAVQIGQGFSLVHGTHRYLHFAAAQGIAAADGTLTLPIFPMLRVIPSDGDVCEFAKPMIQGSLSGNEVAWQFQTAPWTDIGTVTITEDE